MAAVSSTCVRSMSNVCRLSRSLLFNTTKNSRTVCRFASQATDNQSNNGECMKTVSESVNVEADGPKDGKQETVASGEQAMKEQNEKFQEDLKDLKDKYMRSLAETENVRNRMQKQIDDAKVFGIQGFCKDLLEVADILGQATQNTPKDQVKGNPHLKTLYDGLTLTSTQMLKVFNRHGLEQIIPAEGDKFDPFVHEALFQVPTPEKGKGGTVAIIQKTGYKLHARTLRPALVGVFKGS